MSEILRYVLVDKGDLEGDYEYASLDEAKRAAAAYDSAVLCRTYTYEDSELVWTPDGSDTWPPEKVDKPAVRPDSTSCTCGLTAEIARGEFRGGGAPDHALDCPIGQWQAERHDRADR